jgi:photosystem II stability/assembly factor-like uncharacterized protein
MATVTLSPNGLDAYEFETPPDSILVGTMDGVVELTQKNGGWIETARDLRGIHVSSLLVGPENRFAYAGSHGNGIFRRSAGGSWRSVSDGLTSLNVYSVAYTMDGLTPVVYAGTEPALLFRCRDGEDRWRELPGLSTMPGRADWDFPAPPNIAHTKHVDFDPRDARTFYVSVEQGALLKTTDAGASFGQLHFTDENYVCNSDVHRIAINPLNPDDLYLSGGDGITRSEDSGITWNRVATPDMRVAYPDATFCSPLDDGTVYTAGAGARPGAWRSSGNADAAFMKSTDHGITWKAMSLPRLRGNIEAATLVRWPGGYGFFVGTTDGEVFTSTDRGLNWALAATQVPPLSKCVHYANVMKGRGAA